MDNRKDKDLTRQRRVVEAPPPKLLVSDLAELLTWYEENLCRVTLRDPRGHQVRFDISRFAYMIKLRSKEGKKLAKPRRIAERIKKHELANQDLGGFDVERAQTLPWIPAIITRPTLIATNKNLLIPGDELYVKEFEKRGYRYKVLYCKRVSESLLVPVTSFPRTRIGVLGQSTLWP
jgi:hypothetical protein